MAGEMAWAQVKVVPEVVPVKVRDTQALIEPDSVRLTGMLGARIAANEAARLLTIDEGRLLAGFRKPPGEQAWIGEHIGKWMHAATLAWVYTGDAKLREKLDRMAAELLKCQQPDGYLGTYVEKSRWTSWDVWVHKYNLIGLLSYYRYTGRPEALAAARRIGDLLCNTFGKDKRDIIKAGEHVGMAATSVMEPMVILYRYTGERRYLDFCDYLMWAWDQPHGPKVFSSLAAGRGTHQTANAKAYEMLSNLVGLCELYRTTGDKKLLPPVVHAWEDVVASRLYITGTASQAEHFKEDHFLPNDPEARVGENCVTVTWLQLNLQLYRLLGDDRFVDQVERTVYNQLAAAQKPSGGEWCYFTALEGKKPYDRGINCCASSGPRGLGLVPTCAYSVGDGQVNVNLYEVGEARLALPDGTKVRIEQVTKYPADGRIELVLHPEKPARFRLGVWIPFWCERARLTLSDPDGKPQQIDQISGRPKRSLVDHEWRDGDRLTLEMDLPVRAVAGQHGNAGKVAFMRGPTVLAADEGLNPELKPLKDVLIASAGSVSAEAEAVAGDRAAWAHAQVFRVPAAKQGGGEKPLRLVPFAEAGVDGSPYQIWLPAGGANQQR